jgi:hypothetical protein
VVISIDSAIDESGTISIDGSRKLIDVGTRSACAIEGFSGNAFTGNNLGRDIRDWVRAHPGVNAAQAISSILRVAANSWNKEHYHEFPQGRKVGDLITTIVCGDEYSDGLGILIAATKIAPDGKAVVVPVERILSPMYVGGAFPTTDIFLGLILKRQIPPDLSSHFRKTYEAVYKDIRGDTSAMDALNATLTAENEMHNESETSFIKPFYPPSPLAQANLKTLFAAVYKSVEANTNTVARPNQVRLITKCGRFATSVEATWRTCKE